MSIEEQIEIEEYKNLRASVLLWEGRRFALAGSSVAFASALLGALTSIEEPIEWPLIASFVLTPLAGANVLTWKCARMVVRMTSYIIVFHRSRWERMQRVFDTLRPVRRAHELNVVVGFLYIALAGVVIGASIATGSTASDWGLGVFAGALTFFLATLTTLMLDSYPRDKLQQGWEISLAHLNDRAATLGANAGADAGMKAETEADANK